MSLPLSGLRSAEVFRLHGLGRMVRVFHDHGAVVLTVVRFSVAGRFATVDFFKTAKLAGLLKGAASGSSTTQPQTERQ